LKPWTFCWLGHRWFPIALLLMGTLGTWLGIFGPLPLGATSWLQAWQTLIAATVASTIASIAAYVGFQNTSRSLAGAIEFFGAPDETLMAQISQPQKRFVLRVKYLTAPPADWIPDL
jgi:hypothetical protein